MRTSALFGVKTFEFFEIYGVSARTRGEGSIFRDFVRTSFMDSLLIMIKNYPAKFKWSPAHSYPLVR